MVRAQGWRLGLHTVVWAQVCGRLQCSDWLMLRVGRDRGESPGGREGPGAGRQGGHGVQMTVCSQSPGACSCLESSVQPTLV